MTTVVLVSCGAASVKKLDEAVFHEGPLYKLKLVRYYENYPMHYTGEVFTVQCSSANTADSPAEKTQEAGWVTVGNGGAIGSTSAAQLVPMQRTNYTNVNDSTLVWTGSAFNISFDACGSFQQWRPSSLPVEQLDTIAKPAFCTGGADCRHLDFLGDRMARYTDVRVHGLTVEFTASSPAFRDGGTLHVRSSDGGATWQVSTSFSR